MGTCRRRPCAELRPVHAERERPHSATAAPPSTGVHHCLAANPPPHIAARRCLRPRARAAGTRDPLGAEARAACGALRPEARAEAPSDDSPGPRSARVRRPRGRVRTPLPRDPVRLGWCDSAHGVRLLGTRPVRLPPLRHPATPLELGRPLVRPPHLAPLPPARRSRLLLRRRPRRHLRRSRPLPRRAALGSACAHLDDGCVLGLLRSPALPRLLVPSASSRPWR